MTFQTKKDNKLSADVAKDRDMVSIQTARVQEGRVLVDIHRQLGCKTLIKKIKYNEFHFNAGQLNAVHFMQHDKLRPLSFTQNRNRTAYLCRCNFQERSKIA